MKKLLLLLVLLSLPVIADAKNKTNKQPVVELNEVDFRTEEDVRFAAEQYVLTRLKAPSSAKFSGYGYTVVKRVGTADRYAVAGYVDSQNSFGAQLRNMFRVILIGTPGNYRITECVIGQ